jgi:hypothetical protein
LQGRWQRHTKALNAPKYDYVPFTTSPLGSYQTLLFAVFFIADDSPQVNRKSVIFGEMHYSLVLSALYFIFIAKIPA